MYIAERWLIGLGVSMWVAMCSFDEVLKKNKEITKGFRYGLAYENITIPTKREPKVHMERFQFDRKQGTIEFHYFMFFAGALIVSLFNKKNEIILYTKSKIFYNISPLKSMEWYLNKTARKVGVAILKYLNLFKEKSVLFVKMLITSLLVILNSKSESREKFNLLLLKKLKEYAEERKSLAQLLLAAIHENKQIKMQHQLESMAKNRLAQHIENTHKEVKDSRSRYFSSHQLYLVMQQENIFLKTRIKKLTKEKGEAESNLMHIMNEVYKSKNKELKAYCCRFIVKTKDSLMRSDVSEEIHKFLKKSQNSVPSASNYHISEQCDVEVNTDYSWTIYNGKMITDEPPALHEENLLSLVSYAPKLKGLPGEMVWTVKDKNGLIEKLYEYDCAAEFDNGDTIRRIREYSVYYDKDCLLDFRNSRTILQETTSNTRLYRNGLNTEILQTSQNFLTGSQAFQNFLQSNNDIVRSSRSKPPPLLRG